MEVNPEKGMHCFAGERPLYHCQERENCNLLIGKKKKSTTKWVYKVQKDLESQDF